MGSSRPAARSLRNLGIRAAQLIADETGIARPIRSGSSRATPTQPLRLGHLRQPLATHYNRRSQTLFADITES
jgi:hypothetical protein